MKPFLYGMLTMLVVASLVTNVILGYLFFNQRGELTSLREQLAIATQSATSSSSTSTGECSETYTSDVYPEFKFTYNNCVWDLQKQDKSQGPVFGSTVTLSRRGGTDKLTFDFTILSVFGSPSACSERNYDKVGSVGYRISEGENKYTYYSSLIPRGTAEYNTMVQAIDLEASGLDPAKVRFCYAPDIPFVTPTTVTAAEQGSSSADPQQKLNAVLGVEAQVNDPANLDDVDEIVKTMTV